MGSRRSLSVAASLAFGALLACLLSSQPSPAQPPAQRQDGPPPPPPHGRYQIEVVGREGASTVFVCDIHTGHVWYRDTLAQTREWTDMGSPAPEPPPRQGSRPGRE